MIALPHGLHDITHTEHVHRIVARDDLHVSLMVELAFNSTCI